MLLLGSGEPHSLMDVSNHFSQMVSVMRVLIYVFFYLQMLYFLMYVCVWHFLNMSSVEFLYPHFEDFSVPQGYVSLWNRQVLLSFSLKS